MATEAVDTAQDTAAATAEAETKDVAAAVETKTEEQVAGPWGDDWRQKIAGDDEKALKRLDRFSSPKELFNSYRAMEQKMSTGETKPSLSENPTDEEVAAFRKANNIPEKPEGYYDLFGNGLVVGEEDRPITDMFLADMHAKNRPPEFVADAIEWYQKEIGARRDALAEEDARFSKATEDELRAEWGSDYRPNENAIEALLDTMPGDLAKNLRGARLADGSPMMGNPDGRRWLAHIAREINPTGSVVPGGSAQQVESLQAKKTELETLMRTDPRAYDRRRDEYRKVITAIEKLGGQAA